MYSQMGDTVLDPFMGMGTTMVAAMLAGRNSIGFEIDRGLETSIADFVGSMDVVALNRLVRDRLDRHLSFVEEREKAGKDVKYRNQKLNCKVMTSQETDMEFIWPESIMRIDGDEMSYCCSYRAK